MIKALGKRVIVQKVDLEIKKGSLLLEAKNYYTAFVMAYGGDVDVAIDVGDIVYIGNSHGFSLEINGSSFISVHEESILAAWKDK